MIIEGKVKILNFKKCRGNVYHTQRRGVFIALGVVKPSSSFSIYSDTTSSGIHPVLKTKGRTIWESR